MDMRLRATGAAFMFVLPLAVRAADPPPKPKPAPKPAAANVSGKLAQPKTAEQKAARQEENKTQVKEASQQARAAQQALNAQRLPGGLTLQRLAEMTLDERTAALANLAPARQTNIQRMVENYSKETPEQQAREREKAGRIAALPPERATQVRQSQIDMRDMAAPRRNAILLEMSKLSEMPDGKRAEYMSKPAFTRRFSQAEILLMENLRGIVP